MSENITEARAFFNKLHKEMFETHPYIYMEEGVINFIFINSVLKKSFKNKF